MSAGSDWSNIRRTIQTKVGNSMVLDGRSVPIYHDYTESDPDNRRESGNQKAAWVETKFLTQGAGRRADALWQLDLYSRKGPPNSTTADQFGLFIDRMATALCSPFRGVDPTGLQRGKFHVLDFSDPTAPTSTTMCLFMQNARGDIGEPDEIARLDFYEDFRRATVTMRFRTVQDASGPASYYTT